MCNQVAFSHTLPIVLLDDSDSETDPSLLRRRIAEETDQLLAEFELLPTERESVDAMLREFVPITPLDIIEGVPPEVWTLILLDVPEADLIKRVSRVCRSLHLFIHSDRSLRIKICYHRIALQRQMWEKTYSDFDLTKTKERGFIPLQLPLPRGFDEERGLLDQSYQDIRQERSEQRGAKICCAFTAITCGCCGLCCLFFGIVALKNKIIHGSCSVDPICEPGCCDSDAMDTD